MLPSLKVRRTLKYVFIGIGPTAEVAAYAYEVLSRQCAKDRRAYIGKQPKNCKPKTKVARGDAYAEGWLSGISAKLEKFAAKPEHESVLLAHMKAKHPNLKTVTAKNRIAGKNVTGNERWHGHQDGRKANLNHAVGGAAGQPALGVS